MKPTNNKNGPHTEGVTVKWPFLNPVPTPTAIVKFLFYTLIFKIHIQNTNYFPSFFFFLQMVASYTPYSDPFSPIIYPDLSVSI